MIWVTVYRLMLILAAVVGLIYTWMALGSPLNPLVLFTVQSNLLLTGFYSWQVVSRRRPPTELKGAVTLYIVITGLVWHFLRMRGASPLEHLSLHGHGLGNFLLHYVTPVMAVIDWLFFDRIASRPKWAAALTWLVYPMAYLTFALVRGALLPPDAWKRYPYPFLDVDTFGYGGVALMALALAVCFVLLGYGLIALHRLVNHAGRTATVSISSSPGNP
ncbi:Pr6Pr family membrane protein [Streptosporangium sp. NBC_01495]|uniref:Pr6Pr family membrane protein n=1 Tax=Streptosporangium sp. NBC_01495 TaxID=2903899 RepID=UPI002E329261|nr:Pr6Pr family membrane protein [Streptosporangium sp. NBC_01495]